VPATSGLSRDERVFRAVGYSCAALCVIGAAAALVLNFSGRERFDILALVLGFSAAMLAGGLPLGRAAARWGLAAGGFIIGCVGVVSRLVA
jgi:hypothetical protein